MRVCTRKTIEAFNHNKPYGKPGDSIWTDGKGRIFSYYTILFDDSIPGTRILNKTCYSNTTTNKQNSLATWLPCGVGSEAVKVPQGTQSLISNLK